MNPVIAIILSSVLFFILHLVFLKNTKLHKRAHSHLVRGKHVRVWLSSLTAHDLPAEDTEARSYRTPRSASRWVGVLFCHPADIWAALAERISVSRPRHHSNLRRKLRISYAKKTWSGVIGYVCWLLNTPRNSWSESRKLEIVAQFCCCKQTRQNLNSLLLSIFSLISPHYHKQPALRQNSNYPKEA